MGDILNDTNTLYWQVARKKAFVDKTDLLAFMNEQISRENKYICVTRPRRFGKTVTANMLIVRHVR